MDWKREASQMCDIYSNSALTIATPISRDSSESMIEKRKSSNIISDASAGPATVSTIVDSDRNTRYGMWISSHRAPPDFFVDFEDWTVFNLNRFRSTASGKDTWIERAWTYQEWILSPRVLHIHNMTLWDCYEGYGNEVTCRSMTPTNMIRNPHHLGSSTMSWEDVVVEFTARGIGKATDRLPALAGLATRHAQKTGHTYLAGLWLEKLPCELLWNRSGGEERPQRKEGYPTWTWASIEAPVIFPVGDGGDLDKFVATASVMATSCRYEQPGTLSQCVSGWLHIRGAVCLVDTWQERIYREGASIIRLEPAARAIGKFGNWWRGFLDVNDGKGFGEAVNERKIYILYVGRRLSPLGSIEELYGIILEKMSEGQLGFDCFRRLGACNRSDDSEDEIGCGWDEIGLHLV